MADDGVDVDWSAEFGAIDVEISSITISGLDGKAVGIVDVKIGDNDCCVEFIGLGVNWIWSLLDVIGGDDCRARSEYDVDGVNDSAIDGIVIWLLVGVIGGIVYCVLFGHCVDGSNDGIKPFI